VKNRVQRSKTTILSEKYARTKLATLASTQVKKTKILKIANNQRLIIT
jgi:hypothetical protein